MSENNLLSVLTREGVLVNVSVRYWRAAKKLRAEDLGLDPDDVTDRLISLGHKKLLPGEALKAFSLIESRAHALVEASTFPFLGGLGRFLPNAKLQEVTDRLKGLEIEFIQAQAVFLGEYSTLRQSALQEWQAAAHQTARWANAPYLQNGSSVCGSGNGADPASRVAKATRPGCSSP